MPAHAQQPLALTFNLDPTSPKGAAVQAALQEAGVTVRPVDPGQLAHPVGYLAGLPDFSPAAEPYTGPVPPEEFLLLCDMDDDGVIATVRAMRTAGCPVGCKAALTEHNRSWPFAQLMQEVSKEHAAMARYRAAQQ